MSVSVRYGGRFGNHLFQYVCARLFADRNGLRLTTPFTHEKMVRMAPQESGISVEGGPEVVLGNDDDILDRTWVKSRYVLEGHCQNSEWYHKARAEIDSFAFPEPVTHVNTKDIVVNIRYGEDYRKLGWVIHPSWYLNVLGMENFEKLHVVTDNPDPDYLSNFRKFDPVVVSSGAEGDWRYLRSFERIVCSNSSFCWWAAFFSRASRIYTFKRWVGETPAGLPIVKLGCFPNGVEVDGPLMGEA